MPELADHPDAPAFEDLREFSMEPVPVAEVERRREAGDVLVESNLREHGDLDVYIDLNETAVRSTQGQDIGTALYRLVQLFGTPNVETCRAGGDLRDRTDTTFKYLFRVTYGVDPEAPEAGGDEEWLVTVHDWHVRLGASVAEWRADPDAAIDVPTETAIVLLALVKNVCSEPVRCEYEEVWY